MTDWNRMFGLDAGPVGIQDEQGGPELSQAPVGLTDADIQALSGLTPNQGTGVSSAAQSPLGSPVSGVPSSHGPLSPQTQTQNTGVAPPLSSGNAQGSKVGVSGEVATKGWSPDSYDAIVSKVHPGDLRGSAQSRKTAGEYEQKTGQEYADALGMKGQAINDQAALNAKIADSKAALESEKARLLNEHAGEIQKMQAVVQAKTEQASANYASQLATIAATRIDHNQLYYDKGTAGKIAMLASSFVGGVLDAKGVKNNIQGTLMKTIDDSVSDQIANLNNQKDVAQGFLQLYNMAVADGSNQIQAKTKLQGMYLTAFEQQAQAELSKYGSELAQQTGKAALADLAMEKANIFKKVRDDAFNQFNALEGHRIAQRGQDMAAATAAADLKFRKDVEQHNREDKKAAMAGSQVENFKKTVITDPFQGGKPLRQAFTEDGAKIVNVVHSAAASNLKDFAELETIMKKAGGTGYSGKTGQLLNSEDEMRARSLYKRIVANSLRVQSGAAVNEAEVERKEQEIGDTQFLASLGSMDTFQQLLRDNERRDIQKVQAWDDTYTRPLSPQEIEWARQNGLTGESQGNQDQFAANKLAEIGANDDKRDKERSGYKSPEDIIAEKASKPHASLIENKEGTSTDWRVFTAKTDLGNARDLAGNKQKGELFNAPDWSKTEYEYVPSLDALKEKALAGDRNAAAKLVEVGATARDKTQSDYALYLADLAHIGYNKDKLKVLRYAGSARPGQVIDLGATPGNDISMEDRNLLMTE